MDNWFLAQVKPNADHNARRNVDRQSFVSVEPKELHTVVRAGRFQHLLPPYLAGCLFLRYASSAAHWYLVNSTYGLVRLVRNGDRSTPEPVALFDEFKVACDRGDIVQRKPPHGKGTHAEILFGSFRNFVGKVDLLSPGGRAMVLLDFMGKNQRHAAVELSSGRAKPSEVTDAHH